MRGTVSELRRSLAGLLRQPRFTVVAVLTIALGIGPCIAIFSVVDGVLLEQLPFHEPERLVWLWGTTPGTEAGKLAPPDILDYRAHCQAVTGIATIASTELVVVAGEATDDVRAAGVSDGFFELLGVEPFLGRAFIPEEEPDGGNPVVILSHGYWLRRLGGDPGVLGSTISVRGSDSTVVGVMPPGFGLLPVLSDTSEKYEVFIPFYFHAPNTKMRRFQFLHAIARLQPGVTSAQAQAELDSIAAELARAHPETNQDRGIRLVPLAHQIIGNLRHGLPLLLGAGGFVLLIACSNVANLLLARGLDRNREIATRLALGAPRARIIRRFFVESLIISLGGGGLGLLIGVWGLRALIAVAPAGVPRLDEVGLDATVVLFATCIVLLTALLVGVAPALQSLRMSIHEVLKEKGSAVSTGSRSRRVSRLNVVAQIALATVLLIGAGLMARSLNQLLAVDPGFSYQQMLTVKMRVPRHVPIDGLFSRQLSDALQALPSVESAAATARLPFSSLATAVQYTVEGGSPTGQDQGNEAVHVIVSPEYLTTMRVPLIQGRHLSYDDYSSKPIRIVISKGMADRHWPGESPIGQRLTLGYFQPEVAEVVGVVDGGTPQGSLAAPLKETIFRAWSARGFPIWAVLRTTQEPSMVAASARTAILELDPDISITNIRTMEDLVMSTLAPVRLTLWLIGAFSILAILLAVVGIYSLLAIAAARRSQEIGIRMALGATQGSILRLILGTGLRLTVAGVTIGVAAAFWLTRALASQLYAVATTDPATYAGVAVVVLIGAFMAAAAPALRAARLDPSLFLHHE
jgi:putative ABC transport system permease protein